MLILSIDTSTPCGSVALLRDGRTVGVASSWTEEAYSSRMFRYLDWVLQETLIGLENVDLFAITTGPGSFTGLRVGLAAVKGWAEVYQKPVAAVSTLEAIAAQSRASGGVVVPALDARRGELYFACYRQETANASTVWILESEPLALAPQDFFAQVRTQAGGRPTTIVTPTPEAIAQEPASAHTPQAMLVEQVSAVLAPVVGEIAWKRAQRGVGLSFVDALTLEANYVRRTDAELKWKAT